MKKSLFVFVFAVSLSASTVFADHPNGLGVGVQGSWNISWVGGGAGGASLSLKLPIIPVYWAVNMGFGVNNFSLGLSGDFYIIDSALVPAINLHWFGGLGGFFNMGGSDRICGSL
jgi:hypothetical protein